jgi:hypothetical protein
VRSPGLDIRYAAGIDPEERRDVVFAIAPEDHAADQGRVADRKGDSA